MSNEIQKYDGDVPAIASDQLVQIAELADSRVKAVQKIKRAALSITNGHDWVDQQGKPYLQASGAEKIANLFNISWRFLTPEPLYEEDPDGHYTYTFKGEFALGGRTIEVEGSRSSKDGFFKQYEGTGRERVEKSVFDRDNKRDVKMAALTNMLGNGITRMLGLRNLTYEDLEHFAGITKDMIGKVEYKSDKPKLTEPRAVGEKAPEAPPRSTADVPAPTCSKCGGEMWDNRQKKEEGKMKPNAPDYKCKDKNCDGLYWPGQWPPKEEEAQAPAPAPSGNGKPDNCPGDPMKCDHSSFDQTGKHAFCAAMNGKECPEKISDNAPDDAEVFGA